jgi:hypothetical protein
MVWFALMQVFSILLEWLSLGRQTAQEKDLEILLLRRQLAIVERRVNKPLRVSRVEKLSLVVLTSKLKSTTKLLSNDVMSSVFFNRKQSSNGTGSWSGANGLIVVRTTAGDREQTENWNIWSSGWPEKTVTGAMVASKANVANWAMRSMMRPWATS